MSEKERGEQIREGETKLGAQGTEKVTSVRPKKETRAAPAGITSGGGR